MAEGAIIQTANLEETFNALKNQDPSKVLSRQISPSNFYKPIPAQNLAPTVSVTGFNRYASASSNAGIIYGQPQFFSPVHTPINWQIPSKRLEQYQWCLTPGTLITCEGYQKPIEEITIGENVLSHDGTFKEVEKVGVRKVNEKIYKITIQSEQDPLEITRNHKIYCVKAEDYSCKYKLKNKVPQRCTPLFGTKCSTYKKLDDPSCQKTELKISHVLPSELKENDCLIFPIPKQELKCDEFTEGKARLLGYYAAEGSVYKNEEKSQYIVDFCLNIDEKETLAKEIVSLLEKEFNCEPYMYVWKKTPNTLRVKCQSALALEFFKKHCPGHAIDKQFSREVVNLNPDLQKHIVACYISGDGHFKVKDNVLLEVSIVSASWQLLDQVKIMLLRNNISTGSIYSEEHKLKYKGVVKIFIGHILSFSESSLKKMGNIFCGKNFKFRDKNSKNHSQIVEGYLLKRIKKIEKYHYNGNVHNIEVKDNHSYVANGCLVHNSRFFYENEPKVASAIDFYSYFPMNDFENECKDPKIKKYFDKLKKRLELPKWLRLMSHEIHLLGDCFPFIEVSCANCGGSGRTGDEICEHEGGTVRRIVILNPDFIEVFTSPMNPDPLISLRPDEELTNMVQRKTPGYDRLTPRVRAMIASGRPIPLDNRSVSHLKYGESGYGRFGIGMVRRLFPILSYKTKLMVAQWIVAERLIVPIKIVKVGSDERPAGPADIAAVQSQLSQTSNDPNLTIITHHAFEIDFVGAAGKVLTLSNEFEFINQEILDGMMINNALLNGEGPTFSNAAVGIEAMIERLETFRREISGWIEKKIYLPEAKRQGFIDENATEDEAEDDEIEYIYPKIKWNSMHLRDQQQFRTFVLQLYEKGLLSAQTVLESFDFNPDQEIERKRYDAVQMAALGQGLGEMGLGQGPAGGGAGGGMGGGFGGGMPGMPGGEAGGGGMPGLPGGEAGVAGEAPIAAPGGAGGGAPPAMATSISALSTQSQNRGPVNPDNYDGKILKQKTRERMDAEKKKIYKYRQNQDGPPGGMTGMRDLKGRIVFTKPERELLRKIAEYRANGLIRYPVVPQFEVKFGNIAYPIDFALPHLKIGVEADGETFHSSPEQIVHDKQRDMKLSQLGWTILRFTDSEIEDRIEQVLSTIVKTIMQKEAVVEKQKASLPE